MDTDSLYQRGLALRKAMLGDAAVNQRVEAMGEFGAPLQHVINAYVYGDLWHREGLGARERSIAMIAMIAAMNRPAELKVHIRGALANGCKPEEIREVLLLITMYCGVPAGNDAHRVALEVLSEPRQSD
jgi:4-carboxymuconolactone decarboxylase